ncbi:MAG: HAMP domain-containing histidine kinase [Deltaproteobacteria bacterium]|nr:HAMP domain-containing histidine kinase [Deltaproteobacteria bacterium]
MFIVSNIAGILEEKRIKDATRKEIENVAASYRVSAQDASPDKITAFLKNYITLVRDNKLAAVDHSPDKKRFSDIKYLFTFSDGPLKTDIYIKRAYLRKEVYAIDLTDLINGLVVMLIILFSLVLHSERKRRTTAMKNRYEKETAELARALQRHEALALLGRMTATLAHEMKTPIATISNLIHTLPSRIQDKKFTERFIAIAKEELHRTQQLIDNLLVYGKDISDTHNEWVNMKELTQGLTKNAGIKISCPNMGIYGDVFYLRLLFENLIRNSIQANAYEIRIRIHANPAHDGSTTDIMFEDNGRGFPQDSDLAVLVNPFVTTRSSGAGLGLFLAQKITLAHEGAIELYHLPKGAGVKISFPPVRIRLYE